VSNDTKLVIAVRPSRPGCSSAQLADRVTHEFVRQPPVTDFRAIVDAVRTTGSVHYPKSSVPTEFVAWRRRVRQAARATGLSISVTRTAGFVVIENRDYEISDDEELATADAFQGFMAGPRVTYEGALHACRGQRMSLVQPHVGRADEAN